MNTIQTAWESFLATAVPKDAPPIQIQETKRAFYMGAGALMGIQYAIGDEDMSEEAAVHILEGVRDEINAFVVDVKRGHA